jgi:hypothetical protein
MIPRWSSKEAGLLLSHGVFLMLRTYLSLVVARLDGEIVRDLVAGNGRAFLWGILKVSDRLIPYEYLNLHIPVVRNWRLCLLHERHDQVP